MEELENLARRLEQQLSAYEKLHVDEIKRFQQEFEAFQRIQADELQMLHKELAQLKTEIAAIKESLPESATVASPAEPTLSRRDLLTGKIPRSQPKQS